MIERPIAQTAPSAHVNSKSIRIWHCAPHHRPTSRSAAGKRRAKTGIEPEIPAATQTDRDEIAERAARLGVTPERVLQEYARIAFADLRRFADWGTGGLVLRTPGALSDADAAAISEITTAGAGSGNYRVKLYDKKAALDAIARHLGMFVRPPRRQERRHAGRSRGGCA